METLIKTNVLRTDIRVRKQTNTFSPAFWATAEEMRFGIVPAILTVVVCLSGIAAAFAARLGVPELIIVGAPTALFLTTIIAVMPMRIIFALAVITTIVDISLFFM